MSKYQREEVEYTREGFRTPQLSQGQPHGCRWALGFAATIKARPPGELVRTPSSHLVAPSKNSPHRLCWGLNLQCRARNPDIICSTPFSTWRIAWIALQALPPTKMDSSHYICKGSTRSSQDGGKSTLWGFLGHHPLTRVRRPIRGKSIE